MSKWTILLLVALVPLLRCHVNAEKNANEQTARLVLKEMDDAYLLSAPLFRLAAEDTVSSDILLRENMRTYYNMLESFDWKNFEDQELRRQFEVILRGSKYPALNRKFKKNTETLQSLATQKFVCPRHNRKKCHLAFVNQVKSIFINSDDREEIKYYWKEWRNKMPNDVKRALRYYVDYYKNMTTPTMNASAVWYEQYEDPNFIVELEEVMETIMPLYRELHAHLRNLLREKYGQFEIQFDGLIPHHLMEQVTYQAWKKTSVLINPFPENLPNMQSEIDAVGYNALDLVNIGTKFFDSLGMQQLTDEFKNEHFSPIEHVGGGSDCKSRLHLLGDVELNYCPRVHYKKLLQIHGDLAQVHYALAKNNNSIGLDQEPCPGFSNALGEAVILSVSTPHHLQQNLKLLNNFDYNKNKTFNRLYRQAVHTLLTLPTYFVHEKLWIDMIDGKIDSDKYKCKYWHYMDKYMGVESPHGTGSDIQDMPYKFYEGIVDQSKSTKKLFGEFLGYEIYRSICLATGEYQPGTNKTLDLCDFADKKEAGEILSQLMSVGSRKSWREIIKPLTTNNLNKLSGEAFLEYFEPIHTWLKEDNKKKYLETGWTARDRTLRTRSTYC